MLILYTKPTCAFSRAVEQYVALHHLTVDNRDISLQEAYKEELVAAGGRARTPFLIDTDKHVSLYESEAIIDHLQTHYVTDTIEHGREIPPGTCSPQF
jgi:glutathione S-transferase